MDTKLVYDNYNGYCPCRCHSVGVYNSYLSLDLLRPYKKSDMDNFVFANPGDNADNRL